jgi:hypothetical protein
MKASWLGSNRIRMVADGQEGNILFVCLANGMSLTSTVTSARVLGKRKADSYTLHLESCSESETAIETRAPILVNGQLVAYTRKKYKCTHPGCEKSYGKPSRLEEHERSHTGIVRNALEVSV